MKFFSFVKDGFFFTPVEIQVSLCPGLPEVKFTGLVDMAIKESAIRLKSAFRKTGFDWPVKQQMIVNLLPAYIKKSSSGMDLALASAILWKTGQVDFSSYESSSLYFYGEVDLNGHVFTPKDWKSLPTQQEKKPLIVGSVEETNYKENIYSVQHLKELFGGQRLPVKDWTDRLKAPEVPDINFSQGAASVLKITATGEHPLLLCGEAGSGKTTIAENLYYILSPPDKKKWEETEQITNSSLSWRPYINPHHTTSSLSIIGGGVPLYPGEISKAHGGLLFLDEYLEFHPKVQESLREPLEKGEIRLVRRGQSILFPAHFLLVATTNLCPCGDYVPNKPIQCSYSLRRCQSYLDRLSGPMMDRFDLMFFSNNWKGEKIHSLKSLHKEVCDASFFRLDKRKQTIPNSHLDLKELESMITKNIKHLLPQNTSHRRSRALLRVARTLSDLKQEIEISSSSIEEALVITVKNFFFLKNRLLNN